jgi:eukaryotic-like serine/threonine-protein kinase
VFAGSWLELGAAAWKTARVNARTTAMREGGSPAAEIGPGDVLAGKYRVDSVLGRGGMGVVLAATHLQLDQRVAIKMLLPETLNNPDLIARFSQEARATVRIQSEHVVRVLDVGALESGAPYMVMEHLVGSDLAQLVKRRGPLPLPDAIDFVLQACEALAEAHRIGIVHRDLKPANQFLTARTDGSPVVKVLDFGISKATLSNGLPSNLTQTSAVMGSPSYMSPEQLKNSKQVDGRADIWSLGLVLHELLTGRVAFHADTLAELHVAILQSAPAPLSTWRPDLPPALQGVLHRCLQKDPARRFSSMAELALALAEYAPQRALVSVERTCRLLGVSCQQRPPQLASEQPGAYGVPAGQPYSIGGASPGHPGHASSQANHGASQSGYAQAQPAHGASQAFPGGPQASYATSQVDPRSSAGRPVLTPAPQSATWAAGQTGAAQLTYGQGALAPPAPWGTTPSGQPPAGGPVAVGAGGSGGLSVAAVLLVILVACVVLGMGGCMMCVCVSAAHR